MCPAAMKEQKRSGAASCRVESWIDQELAGCGSNDLRLGKRFRRLIEQLAEGPGESIPWACQDWESTKAAYRFFAHAGVSAEQILAGHFHSTRERFSAGDSPILVRMTPRSSVTSGRMWLQSGS